MSATELSISGVTRLDTLELKKQLGESMRGAENGISMDDNHGILGTTTAIVVVSLAALRVLAVHLARKHERQSFAYTVDVKIPDGSTHSTTIKWDTSSTLAPEVAVLQQLGKVCAVEIPAA